MSRAFELWRRPLWVLLFAMVAGGVLMRVVDLGFPDSLTWDEHHFVKNARNYLAGRPDWNDHAPLGKLLLALSIRVLGDTAFAFRLPSCLLGIATIFGAGGLAYQAFRTRQAAMLAASFTAVDGFLIAYSRTALLDGMLTSLSLVTLWLMTLRPRFFFPAVGVALGSAMAIKMSAITLFGPLAFLAVLQLISISPLGEKMSGVKLFGRPIIEERAILWAFPAILGIAVMVYLSWWVFGLGLTDRPNSYSDAIRATKKMMAHHAKLTDWEHPLLSRWWTWWLPKTPIMLRHDVVSGGFVRAMTSMGNPLLWWSAVVAAFFAVTRVVSRASERRVPDLAVVWLLVAAVAYLSPWVLTNRDSYIYHYLPIYSIELVVLAGVVSSCRFPCARMVRLCWVGAVLVVSAFYAPVWAQLPISPDALLMRPFIR